MPNLLERFPFQITQRMFRILIKTTGYHHAIPGNNRCVPQTPAMIVQSILYLKLPKLIFPVSAEFIDRWNQVIWIPLIIVYLRCLKTHFVNSRHFCKFFNILNLVLVWLYHQKLKKDKWSLALQFLFPVNNIARA